MCHTHKVDVKLRSLVLIRMSQRNLLWNYCQCWGGWLANQQSCSTVSPASNTDMPFFHALGCPVFTSKKPFDIFETRSLLDRHLIWLNESSTFMFFWFSLFWLKFSDKWQISLSHWLQHWPTYLLNRWALPSYLGECKDISQQQSIKTSALTLSSTICLKQVHAARQFFICSTNKAREKKGEGG